MGDLKKFFHSEFRSGDISKLVWGKEYIHCNDDKQLISNIIADLKKRSNGTFSETSTLVLTGCFD
jgi:hypothetical protein